MRIEPRWTYGEVRRAALALARDVERRAPSIATSKWWKEERHGVFLDYNQNAKDRTVASAYSVRPLPDARVSFPLRWDEVADVVAEDFTLATVPALYQERGDAGAGIDEAVGSLDSLLELSARDEAEGLGDAPWPPNYAKQEGEPPRVQPSRKRKPDEAYEGRGKDGGPPPEVAAERAAAVAAGDRNAGLPTEWEGTRPTPTGRRKSNIPVIEIARAATKAEVNEGLERWKARHPEVVEHLEPADILTDGMRGRAYVWYRLRVNLIHVPEDKRPAQEPLDPGLQPVGGLRMARPERPAGQGAEEEARGGRRAGRLSPRQGCQRTIQAVGPSADPSPAVPWDGSTTLTQACAPPPANVTTALPSGSDIASRSGGQSRLSPHRIEAHASIPSTAGASAGRIARLAVATASQIASLTAWHSRFAGRRRPRVDGNGAGDAAVGSPVVVGTPIVGATRATAPADGAGEASGDCSPGFAVTTANATTAIPNAITTIGGIRGPRRRTGAGATSKSMVRRSLRRCRRRA